MKRKDWKIKNYNKNFSGNNNYLTNDLKVFLKKPSKKRRFFRLKYLYLRRLFLLRVEKLSKKNLIFNYFFFKKMLDTYKYKKKWLFNNMFFKTFIKKKAFFPEYQLGKNVFNRKLKGKSFFKDNNVTFFHISNKYNKENIGLTHYLYLNDESNYNNFLKNLLDDNNKNIVHIKDFNTSFYDEKISADLNYFFNFNLSLNYSLEIYKIIIILYINKLNKKYI